MVPLTLALVSGGCGTRKGTTAAPENAAAAATPSSTPGEAPAPAPGSTPDEAPAGPEAKVHISYAHPGDFLSSLVVTKYSGAQTLQTIPSSGGNAAVVRFEGGVVVWQFGVEKSLLGSVPVIGGGERKYAPAEVKYGALPEHFTEQVPDSGPPEPLEPDHFYVFAATRGSGSVNYEAVKVNGDGSLEAYEADPRAGTSYWLCCSIGPGFTVTAPPS